MYILSFISVYDLTSSAKDPTLYFFNK